MLCVIVYTYVWLLLSLFSLIQNAAFEEVEASNWLCSALPLSFLHAENISNVGSSASVKLLGGSHCGENGGDIRVHGTKHDHE